MSALKGWMDKAMRQARRHRPACSAFTELPEEP